MRPRTWATLLVTSALGAAAMVAAPYRAITPGVLTAGHEAQRDDCFSCHTPLRGASREKCVACHALEGIGFRTVAGAAVASANARSNLLHRALRGECASCHREHQGRTRAHAMARFVHEELPVALRGDCAACHLEQRPKDALHASDSASCGECHATASWRPARFDHARFFRFDRHHPAECAACHPGGDFKKWSCTGCHEHRPAKIAEEHREEGIQEFADCVKCHRSGDKHEARRGGGEGGGGRDGDQEEDDDDDDD